VCENFLEPRDARRASAEPPMLFFKATTRLRKVEDALQTIEGQMKAIQLEWEDTYDRLRVLMQRIVNRAQRAEQQAEGDIAQDTESPPPVGLSERAAAINAKILARRNRLQRPS
jgi:shikimate kinase